MRNDFPGFYRPSDEEFTDLWNKCIFVLDTNILFNLYRYPKSARDDMFKVLEQISSRLWIPHQVALEFQQGRLGVIAGQAKKFDDVRAVLDNCIANLSEALEKLQKKRHSELDSKTFPEDIQHRFSNFKEQLGRIQAEQPEVSSTDVLRDQIDRLLSNKVGPPLTAEELSALYVEGKERYEHERPPGYKDLSKEKDKASGKDRPCYLVNGSEVQREFGDLIIWKQLIQYVNSHDDVRSLIFVTDEEKEDWWWTVKGKLIGPRPELVQEIKEATHIERFYMYNSESMLQYATEHLGIQIEPTSIEEAQEIRVLQAAAEKSQIPPDDRIRKEILAAVARYLASTTPGASAAVVASPKLSGGPDIIFSVPNQNIGYEVVVLEDEPRELTDLVTHALGTRTQAYARYNLVEVRVVVVLLHQHPDWHHWTKLARLQLGDANREKIVIGVITYTNSLGQPPFHFHRIP